MHLTECPFAARKNELNEKKGAAKMIQIRKSAERGQANFGWLDSKHTFSFGQYYDPAHMGFKALRVINEDRIKGGTGFGTHPHRDMEIVSYVVSGALEHKDSIGTTAVIRAGDVQRMSAGTGIQHSEYNHSPTQEAHFLQIWILPSKTGIPPSYDQKSFSGEFQNGDLVLVASREGRAGSITLNQDVNIFAANSPKSGKQTVSLNRGRGAWIQVVRGQVEISAVGPVLEAKPVVLAAGDGASIDDANSITLSWRADSEFLVFDLP